MQSPSLKERTLRLLQGAPQSDRDLARAIGTSVPWIRLFKNGDIKAPSVDTVQRLYEYLAEEPLFKG